VGKERGIVGAQEKFNKKIGMNSFHRKNEFSIILASLGVEFQSAKQNFMEFSIQNGGNWR
jgi:hypothetical protein